MAYHVTETATDYGPEPLTRLRFWAQLRQRGWSRAPIQVARNGTTYALTDDSSGNLRATLTVAKGHQSTVVITAPGNRAWSGIYVDVTTPGGAPAWGVHVEPHALGRRNLLEVILDVLDGRVERGA